VLTWAAILHLFLPTAKPFFAFLAPMNVSNMPNKRIRYLANVIIISLTLVFFALIVIRAQKLALTQNEAQSYFQYLDQPFKDILLYQTPAQPNPYILNTVLTKIVVKILGVSSFNLRLPNLFFALVFFWNAAFLSKNLRTVWSQVCAFLIFSAHVYFFDYFSLATGHGMALALLMASLHHIYLYIQVDNGNHTYRALIFAALAAYANLNYVYFFSALLLVLPLMAWADGERRTKAWRKLITAIMVVGLSTAAVLFIPLRQAVEVLGTGPSGFWGTTVQSTLSKLLYGQFDNWLFPLSFGVAAALIGIGTLLIFDILILKKEKRFYYQPLLILLLLMVGLQWLLYNFMGLPYLTGKAALFYLLTFLALIVFTLERMQEPKIKAWIRNLVFTGVAVLILINFGYNINLRRTFDWPLDAANKRLLKDIKSRYKITGQSNISLGASPTLQPSLNFYQQDKYSQWLAPVESDSLHHKIDYFAISPATDSLTLRTLETREWKLVKDYFNGIKLYRKP
jgi:hypothetical protein